MIVRCDKCSTRFRIADDKVTPGGVKVRCSRCAHVFVVTPASDASDKAPVQNTRGPDVPAARPPVSDLKLSPRPDVVGPRPEAQPGSPSSAAVAAALGFSGPDIGSSDPVAALAASSVAANALSAPVGIAPAPTHDSADFSDVDAAFRRAVAASGDINTGSVSPPVSPASGAAGEFAAGSPSGDVSGLAVPGNGGPAATTGDQVRFPAPSFAMGDGQNNAPRFPPPASGPFGALDGGPDAGDIPGLLAPTDDDPFANIDLESPSALDLSADFPRSAPAQAQKSSALYGMIPGRPEPAGPIPLGPPKAVLGSPDGPRPLSEPMARLELDLPEEAAGRRARSRSVSGRRAPPAGPRGFDAMAVTDGRWPTLAGILLGLTVLVFFLPDLGQRAVEALLPPHWGVEWSGAVAPATPVQVNRARVRTYPIRSGDRVLVVAGDARNRTDQALAGVEVVVGLYDGGRRVGERRGLINVVLTEGQLTQVADATELKAAYDDAVKAHGERGVVLPPGTERPFMVVFPTVPENASDLKFRISFFVPPDGVGQSS